MSDTEAEEPTDYHRKTIEVMVKTVMAENQAFLDRRAELTNRVYVALGIFIVLMLLLFGGIAALWSFQRTLNDQVSAISAEQVRVAKNENAYKNGAQACANGLAVGAQVTDYCMSAEVVKYWNPELAPSIPSSSQAEVNHEILCRISAKLDIYEASCVPAAP